MVLTSCVTYNIMLLWLRLDSYIIVCSGNELGRKRLCHIAV